MFEKIIIAYDNHGAEIIKFITSALDKVNQSYEVLDCSGLDYVKAAKLAISRIKANYGLILACGTGVGVSMVANKYKGIRAALCMAPETAYFSRKHENANCLCLASSYTDGVKSVKMSVNKLGEIVKTFMTTEFDGGRHLERIKLYSDLGEKVGK